MTMAPSGGSIKKARTQQKGSGFTKKMSSDKNIRIMLKRYSDPVTVLYIVT